MGAIDEYVSKEADNSSRIELVYKLVARIEWPKEEGEVGGVWIGDDFFSAFNRVKPEDDDNGIVVGWWFYNKKYYMHDASMIRAICSDLNLAHGIRRK